MDKYSVRMATQADKQAIADLTTRAFNRPDEAAVIDRLEKDGDVILQIVAVMEEQIMGHLLVYPVGVRGKLGGVGIGPMSVEPWVQREGVGKALVNSGLISLRDNGVSMVFVLGHPEYYPKFGFSQEAAANFEAPWKGPQFMALRLRYGPPMSGTLLFPAAFGVPRDWG